MCTHLKYKFNSLLLLCFGFILFANAGYAKCPSSWFSSNWLVDYSGSIANKYDIGMTLVFDGNSLKGVYYYDKYLKNINVSGRFTGNREFELHTYDHAGNMTDTFIGTFPKYDARFGNGSPLECEVMIGQWHRKSDGVSYPFYLSIDNAVAGTLSHRYSGAGAKNDKKIEAAVQAFWYAIKTGNKQEAASFIEYPIAFDRGSEKALYIINKEQFISRYAEIITPRIKSEILYAVPHNMFNNYEGVMLGNGVVWFNADGRVISIQDTYPLKSRRH